MPRPSNPNRITVLTCLECGKEFPKETKEVTRRIKAGKTEFFCGLPCSLRYRMRETGVTYPTIQLNCPVCGTPFPTTMAPKARKHCSRSCANTTRDRVVTDAMREAGRRNVVGLHTTEVIAASLRSREAWKYRELGHVLNSLAVAHTFEFPLDPFVYDLALHDSKTLVEFDGPDHTYGTEVQATDEQKDLHAQQHGWHVVRVEVEPATAISPSCIRHLL